MVVLVIYEECKIPTPIGLKGYLLLSFGVCKWMVFYYDLFLIFSPDSKLNMFMPFVQPVFAPTHLWGPSTNRAHEVIRHKYSKRFRYKELNNSQVRMPPLRYLGFATASASCEHGNTSTCNIFAQTSHCESDATGSQFFFVVVTSCCLIQKGEPQCDQAGCSVQTASAWEQDQHSIEEDNCDYAPTNMANTFQALPRHGDTFSSKWQHFPPRRTCSKRLQKQIVKFLTFSPINALVASNDFQTW